ncbi:MAG: serine/threonine protein kinase [Polyangiaceae bacterium]|nr:serine/threonine protein kinase [Polyangiaceae bacterium]
MAAKKPKVGIGLSNGSNGVLVTPPPPPIEAGEIVAGKYRVEHLIKVSPSTFVLAARHVQLRSPVIIKLFAAYTDEQGVALTQRIELARAAAVLRGAHVAPIVEVGTTADGMPYIATERFEGPTLEDELNARQCLPFPEAARWIVEACDGVAEAHARGIVHGDLRPTNLLLAEPGQGTVWSASASVKSDARADNDSADRRILKVLDFGVASPIDTASVSDDSASVFCGSPAYLAPEQIREPERVSPRTDIWALGVILHELVAGTLPFPAEAPSEVLLAVIFDAAPLLTDAPYELARVVNKCLSKDPASRPADVGELARALAPFVGEDGAQMADHVCKVLSERDETSGRRKRRRSDRKKEVPLPAIMPAMPVLDRTMGGSIGPSLRARALHYRRIRRTTGAAFAAVVAVGIFALRTTLHVTPRDPQPEFDLPQLEPLPVTAFVPTTAPDDHAHSNTVSAVETKSRATPTSHSVAQRSVSTPRFLSQQPASRAPKQTP